MDGVPRCYYQCSRSFALVCRGGALVGEGVEPNLNGALV